MIPSTSVVDRRQAVLVVVDIQERLVGAMGRKDRVLDGTLLLLRVAVLCGVPVVVTRQYPEGLGDLAPIIAAELEAAKSGSHPLARVDKLTFDCFGEPEFTRSVAEGGRRQIVIAGMETHICVTQTALTGLREGFDVHVVADACCSRTDEAHMTALARLGRAGAVVTTAESVAYELVGRAGTPEFKALLSAVKR